MKREKVYVDERRERIRDILREKSQVRVEALAEELKVSVITIRRDLQYLEEQKQLIRVYGGAVAVREQRGADGRNPAVPGFDCALCGQSGRGRRYTVS